MRNRRWHSIPKNVIDEMKRLALLGADAKGIAKRVGASTHTVYCHTKKERCAKLNRKISVETEQEIRRRILEGESAKEAALSVGLSKRTVQKYAGDLIKKYYIRELKDRDAKLLASVNPFPDEDEFDLTPEHRKRLDKIRKTMVKEAKRKYVAIKKCCPMVEKGY